MIRRTPTEVSARLRAFVFGTALLIGAGGELRGQDPAGAPRAGAVRVFLDCEDCDDDYVQTETPWVAFVRDRADSDVHVLVTSISTGAGGSRYTINLVGVGRYAGRSDTLQYVSQPNEANDAVRTGLTRTLQLGLAPYVARTPQASRLRFDFGGGDDDEENRRTTGDDPWNAWVFEIGADGSVEREENFNGRDIETSLEARRITQGWKIGFRADGEYSREVFFDVEEGEEGEPDIVERTVSLRHRYGAGGVAVKSLGAHWGAGLEAIASSSTFENMQLALRAAPAIEYSLWPYDEATRRQLTFQYSAGISSFDYREETIYGKFTEVRPTHAFVVGYDVRQPWGDGSATLESASYLDDAKQYRLEFDGEIEIRLFRGLSLDLSGNAALIRDQLSLVKRGATRDEIVLRLRELRTGYHYEMSVGFSYTFGSIFNSVVNPRFGDGPGDILR
jgi:hypothetical protein